MTINQPRSDLTIPIAIALGFIGISVFFIAFWTSMGPGVRVVTTLGGGMLLHMLAMMAWQKPQTVTPGKYIFFIAVLLQSVGWVVLLGKAAPGVMQTSLGAMLIMLLMGAQEIAVYAQYRLKFILGYVIAFSYCFTFALLHYLGGEDQVILLGLGVSMLLVAHGLTATTLAQLSPVWYVAGSCLFFTTLFTLTRGSIAELLYIAAALGFQRAGLRLHSRALLWSGSFFTITYLGYLATGYMMYGPLWSVSLVLLAAAVYGYASFTLKMQRRYLG